MTPTLDYTRWTEPPLGLAYRRWVIASTGLRHLFRTRFFRILLLVAWCGGVLMAAAGFVFTQSIATGGWLENLATSFGPRAEAVVSALCAFVLLYPDIVVEGVFTSIFWAHSFLGPALSLVALTVLAPRLVARDRASNALTIYLARPLTPGDYLLGKLGIIVGTLLAVWTGPLLFGWLLGVLFAPDRLFILHSLEPLGRALLFNAIALIVLAAVAFGVSSTTKTSRATILVWIGLWIVLGTIADIPAMPEWVRHASFSYDLHIVRDAVFRLDEALIRAGESLPLLNANLAQDLTRAGAKVRPHDLVGVMLGLGALVTVSCVAFFGRLKPE
jgi:ABC-2 type transport system permease protein